MDGDRSWMYQRHINRRLNLEFFLGVNAFLDYAFSVPSNIINGNCIKCPCASCRNLKSFDRHTVEYHLNSKGFRNLYQIWYMHGEEFPDHLIHNETMSSEDNVEDDDQNEFVQMIFDVAGPEFESHAFEEDPNPEARAFYNLLKSAEEPLWDGCEKEHTQLSCVAELLNIKSDLHLTKEGFNRIISAVKKWLPKDNRLPPNYYQCRKLVKDLGMNYHKFDVCPKDCMLYYGSNIEKDKCDVCNHPRFKDEGNSKKSKRVPHKVLRYLPITPRLKRLYMSPVTAEQMRWHKDGVRDKIGMMVHPADGQAWKDFDGKHRDFAGESRNVRLGLCSDGFSPFNIDGRSYSLWPVFIVCYNLPPELVMQDQYIFMSMLIPGPNSLGNSIDVYLQPLVDELRSLWTNGVEVYDSSRKENFNLRAALMWTINDLPAYAMLSGWSTKGKLGCPVCMEDTRAFQLDKGGKTCWFDHRRFLAQDHPFRFQSDSFRKDTIETGEPSRRLNGDEVQARVMSLGDVTFGQNAKKNRLPGFGEEHNWLKKSIFWKLPYWSDHPVRHFIDVMHLEMNFFKNIFFTIMDIKDKTKDNLKAREDMAKLCVHPLLELCTNVVGNTIKPRASYCLNREQKRQICEWIKGLQFPDGYASNLSNVVNVHDCSFVGLKTHDCHIFMERLLPAVLRDFVPDEIWEVIVEVSNFFRDLCSRELDPNHVRELETNIVVTLCKLEKIFPPGFFDSMEHLVVHLCFEALMCGPIQFHWMYPFERSIRRLKRKVSNKARVEGSIVEAYVLEEISTFCCSYFSEDVINRLNRPNRYNDEGFMDDDSRISSVSYPGRATDLSHVRTLSEKEKKAAQFYMLTNCPEFASLVQRFDDEIKALRPNLRSNAIRKIRSNELASWIRHTVLHEDFPNGIRNIGLGPLDRVTCYNMYDVNGFRFHTERYGATKKTTNNGVCVKGSNCHDGPTSDYYGVIEEIVELEYKGINNKLVLLKCRWFDIERGIRVDDKHGLVEVNHKSSLKEYDPFILAYQAVQVYYLPYASKKRERRDWWVATKTRSRLRPFISFVDDPMAESVPTLAEYFQEEGPACPFEVGIGEALDEPELLVNAADPEIVPEDELLQLKRQREDA